MLVAALSCCVPASALAQQPFAVDDAEVTPTGWWHLEFNNELDVLHRGALPARWQNVFDAEVVFGARSRVEVGVAVPAISVVTEDDRVRSTAAGVGDTSISAKIRLSRAADARHAFAAGFSLELPSGNEDRLLGSGLVDYGVTFISQHRLDARWTLRANGGVVLAGNTQTGAIGFKERGTVLVGGGSLVAAVSDTVQLGGEVVAAWSEKAVLGGKSVVAQIGGNVVLRPGLTMDLGVGTGWLDATPQIALQAGVSIDLAGR